MIRKVALVQALREAFPESFSGMYSEEEGDGAEASFLAPPAPAEADAAVSELQPQRPAQIQEPVTPPPTQQGGQAGVQMDMASAFFND